MLVPQKFKVSCHTDRINQGSTFVAIPGFKTNGENFIQEAIARGATTIVTQNRSVSHDNVKIIYSDNARTALATLTAQALDYPAKKLKLIGITGTKGKTTTCYLIEHLLRSSGHTTALLGTIVNKIKDNEVPSNLTTHESDYLHHFFYECVQQKVTHVVMEVSAHALSLARTYGLEFDAIGFTNLAPEHLDFYETMDNYFRAKAVLLDQVKTNGILVINNDDAWGKKLAHQKQLDMSKKFEIVDDSLNGLMIKDYRNNQLFTCPSLFGSFNAYNIYMALEITHGLGLSYTQIQEGLTTFPGVPGRLQKHILKNGTSAFVDFAHNASSMEAILKALRPLTNHLIVVFGCGGDRDATKRPMMGQLAGQYADHIIITDDNPRTEDRYKIINEIFDGIAPEKKHSVVKIPDRKQAIAHAVQNSYSHSIIALLGKGHETTYIINNEQFDLNDFEEIKKY